MKQPEVVAYSLDGSLYHAECLDFTWNAYEILAGDRDFDEGSVPVCEECKKEIIVVEEKQ